MSFGGLTTAVSGLYAQRRGMEVTGQNLANVNTPGYTRQRADLAALGGPTAPSLWSTLQPAGGGVTVVGVERLRDAFLEQRALDEHGRSAYLTATSARLGDVEAALGEPGDSGLGATLSEFWNSWDDLANRPDDLAARQAVLAKAETTADGFRRISGVLSGQWSALREQTAANLVEANQLTSDVARLNGAIRAGTVAGTGVNELADSRDELVRRLADLLGASARPSADGMVDVILPTGTLVHGTTAQQLTLQGATSLDGVPAPTGSSPPAVTVAWASSGTTAGIRGGTVGGSLEGLNTVLPSYRSGLDAVAAQLAAAVNTGHAAGYDATGAPGGAFFSGSTAATLGVAITDPQALAANAAPGTRDGANAAALAELGSGSAAPDAAYRRLVVGLGVATQAAQRRSSIQDTMTAQADAARDAVAGVNSDEELAQMVAYQHAYEASARYLTAVDELLDTLVNRTGTVGR